MYNGTHMFGRPFAGAHTLLSTKSTHSQNSPKSNHSHTSKPLSRKPNASHTYANPRGWGCYPSARRFSLNTLFSALTKRHSLPAGGTQRQRVPGHKSRGASPFLRFTFAPLCATVESPF